MNVMTIMTECGAAFYPLRTNITGGYNRIDEGDGWMIQLIADRDWSGLLHYEDETVLMAMRRWGSAIKY
jgi:hypothetical protein